LGPPMTPLEKLRDLGPTKKAVSLLEEFKNFALKGSVIDLAIGVIIGGAFGGLVKSLVENIIMPVVNLVMPAQNSYQDWAIVVGTKTIPYGKFLGDVVNFLILALVLYFFIVKFLGWVMRVRNEPATPPPPTKDQELLMEIRDLLKHQAPQPGPEATT
jgi:large conductance mechanosensitive channel